MSADPVTMFVKDMKLKKKLQKILLIKKQQKDENNIE
jgi:hypothetical protein